jgi:uncharacterized DUF497 family protein
MRYLWDEGKRRQNVRDHGVDFAAVYRFEWNYAVVTVDDREDYGELRERAISFIGPCRTCWSSPSAKTTSRLLFG